MATDDQVLRQFGARVREHRKQRGLSQEDLSFECNLDRTYLSQVEGGKRNISLQNIKAVADALRLPITAFFEGNTPASDIDDATNYRAQEGFSIKCGFGVSSENVLMAAKATAQQLQLLPFSLFQSVDLKTLSSIVGALFAGCLAGEVDALVNPIEKGHPDIIPKGARGATEAQLRNYPEGLEIKVTVGNVEKGSDLQPGVPRIEKLTGLTWQAHHREVERLMGMAIDFGGAQKDKKRYPVITGVFYTDNLSINDWGEISGTTGRNTKVSGMRVSGKEKMGRGWVLLLNEKEYLRKYAKMLSFTLD